jgi:hypothetical protein
MTDSNRWCPAVLLFCALQFACTGIVQTQNLDASFDSGTRDASTADAAVEDASVVDAGFGDDAGTSTDAGPVDDAGMASDAASNVDAGVDAGLDSGTNFDAGLDAGRMHFFTCAPPLTSSYTSDSGAPLRADVSSGNVVAINRARTFAVGAPIQLSLLANTVAPDTLTYEVRDVAGNIMAQNSTPIQSGTSQTTVACTSDISGYFQVHARFTNSNSILPSIGTRPQGFASFGLTPNLTSLIPNSGPLNRRRFGMQGTNFLGPGVCCAGDGYQPIYELLGATWTNERHYWSELEPTMSTNWMPNLTPAASSLESADGLSLMYTLFSLPGWAIGKPTASASYPPLSFLTYQSFMTRVGQHAAARRAVQFPSIAKNYYQVLWEPDVGTGNQWLGTDAELVSLMKAAHAGLHAGDANAVVLGLTYSDIATNVVALNRLGPLGMWTALDGLSVHGYYTIAQSDDPATAPERSPLVTSMRQLRALMTAHLPAHAPLFVTETGVIYAQGYSATYPDLGTLQRHAAHAVRGHIAYLGEGADVTYLFYSADFSEAGFGLYFNHNYTAANPVEEFGSANISPKPAAMAVATMTRMLEGSTTLGYLNGLPTGVYGYSFLRDGKVITAMWASNITFTGAATYALDVGIGIGTVSIVDLMGNQNQRPFTNGKISLTLSEFPSFVVSTDVAVARSHVTLPLGYDPLPF